MNSPTRSTAERTMAMWLAPALGCICAITLPVPAMASYPERPIRIIVPTPAGAAPDLFARHLSQKLSASLKQPVIIENRPGANGLIGTGMVAKADADGYTLLNTSTQHVMLKPLLHKLEFDPDADFVAVTTTSATELILIVPATSRFATVSELVAAAKSRPGELNFASAGIGSSGHLAGQAFLSATSTTARHIPMKGSTESVTGVAGNQVDYALTAISNTLALIQSGKLKALASTGPIRHALLPLVPTMGEALPPGFVYETWQSFYAPAKTPRNVLELLNRELARFLGETDTREFFSRYGARTQPRTLRAAAEFVQQEARKADELVRAIGANSQ